MKTLLLIKPNVTKKNKIGAVLKIIESANFKIKELKTFKMTQLIAQEFYQEHIGKPFFESLVEFMTSEKIVAAILEKENAVKELRIVVGNTNPEKADYGTVRKIFGENVQENAVHASDSKKSAKREISIIF